MAAKVQADLFGAVIHRPLSGSGLETRIHGRVRIDNEKPRVKRGFFL
jgi:hypothetical protein